MVDIDDFPVVVHVARSVCQLWCANLHGSNKTMESCLGHCFLANGISVLSCSGLSWPGVFSCSGVVILTTW